MVALSANFLGIALYTAVSIAPDPAPTKTSDYIIDSLTQYTKLVPGRSKVY